MRITTMLAAAFLGLAPWATAQEEVTKEAVSKKKLIEGPVSKYPEDVVVVGLMTGDWRAAGTVAVWNDGATLFVEYRASGQWTIHRTRLDVELDLEDIPQNKKGSPLPGKFEFNDKHGKEGVTEFLYEIPLADKGWSDGDIVYVAASAKVSELMDGSIAKEKAKGSLITKELAMDGSIAKEKVTKEVAWGDGEEFLGPKWGMYFPYRIGGIIKKKPETPPSKEIEEPAPKEEGPSKDTEEGEPKEENPGPGFPTGDDPDPAEETDPGPPPNPVTEDDPDPPEEM